MRRKEHVIYDTWRVTAAGGWIRSLNSGERYYASIERSL